MRKTPGFFISFESTVEGIGKTTQSKRLAERLTAEGYDAVWTREPGGTPVGAKLREILLNPEYDLSKAAELLLMTADRAQHYKEVLKPALKAGKIVISDRYFDSTLVYQGHARGWKAAVLYRLHSIAAGALLPDLTIVLDGVSHRPIPNQDRFEMEDSTFSSKVKRGMLHLAQKDDRYVLMDANKVDETGLADQIWGVVQGRIAVAGLPKP